MNGYQRSQAHVLRMTPLLRNFEFRIQRYAVCRSTMLTHYNYCYSSNALIQILPPPATELNQYCR